MEAAHDDDIWILGQISCCSELIATIDSFTQNKIFLSFHLAAYRRCLSTRSIEKQRSRYWIAFHFVIVVARSLTTEINFGFGIRSCYAKPGTRKATRKSTSVLVYQPPTKQDLPQKIHCLRVTGSQWWMSISLLIWTFVTGVKTASLALTITLSRPIIVSLHHRL